VHVGGCCVAVGVYSIFYGCFVGVVCLGGVGVVVCVGCVGVVFGWFCVGGLGVEWFYVGWCWCVCGVWCGGCVGDVLFDG